jgi:hypothetical protein
MSRLPIWAMQRTYSVRQPRGRKCLGLESDGLMWSLITAYICLTYVRKKRERHGVLQLLNCFNHRKMQDTF